MEAIAHLSDGLNMFYQISNDEQNLARKYQTDQYLWVNGLFLTKFVVLIW